MELVLEMMGHFGDDSITPSSSWTFPPISVNARRYAWQKQALFKGRSWLYGTRWAGWGFETNVVISVVNELSSDYLRSTPIFNHYPEYMFTNAISSTNINRILSRGIPELSYPLGYTSLNQGICRWNFDLNDNLFKRTDEQWPQRDIDFNDDGKRPRRWLHTDLLNVGHFFTYKLFLKIIELGELLFWTKFCKYDIIDA